MKRIDAKLQIISATCICSTCLTVSEFLCVIDIQGNQKLQCQLCGSVFSIIYNSEGIHEITKSKIVKRVKDKGEHKVQISSRKETILVHGNVPPAACKKIPVKKSTSVHGITPPAMKRTIDFTKKPKK